MGIPPLEEFSVSKSLDFIPCVGISIVRKCQITALNLDVFFKLLT